MFVSKNITPGDLIVNGAKLKNNSEDLVIDFILHVLEHIINKFKKV